MICSRLDDDYRSPSSVTVFHDLHGCIRERMNTSAKIQGINHWLVAAGLLDADMIDQLRASAGNSDLPLVTYLVENAILDATAIALAASRQFRLPLLDLDAVDAGTLPAGAVSPALIRRHRLLPLHRTPAALSLAVADPACEDGINDIRFQCNCPLNLVVVEQPKLDAAINILLGEDTPTLTGSTGLEQLDIDAVSVDHDDEEETDPLAGVDETPVMRFVNRMLIDAIRHRASDIHIESYEKSSRIRFREDGLLREIARPQAAITRKITARLKVMARLDIAEKRLPQDGRFKLKLAGGRAIDFRVSTLPALWGEKVVLRLLDPGPEKLDLDALGFSAGQQRHYRAALDRQQGLVLVTGPTGSGKSLSLYAGLHLLNTRERNIATAEDPVELHLEGVNQVAVNPGIGFHFADALRAFLRQDPDVVMVGEIRDLETAQMAVKASQTGHLVLSTLHTNSAPETVGRLLDMGVERYHLATSLSLVIAQRLLRKLCEHCKKPVDLPDALLLREGFSPDAVAGVRLHTATGCDKCHGGYKGRIGIYETLPITDTLSRVIMDGGNSIQIAELAAKAGFNPLRASALEKAAQGVTSLAEVNRIT